MIPSMHFEVINSLKYSQLTSPSKDNIGLVNWASQALGSGQRLTGLKTSSYYN